MYSGYWGREDRRRFQRLKMHLTVFFKILDPLEGSEGMEDIETEATMVDLSAGGMAFITNHDLPPWSKLSIKLHLLRGEDSGEINFSEPLELTGEVRSNTPLDFNERRIGICFKDARNEDRCSVSDFVDSIIRPY
jgi:hypothetical protein